MAIPTLPAEWYVDPAIARRERQEIFARNWLLLGPEAGLEETGSWRAEELYGWPVVVVRGGDGVLRGFHNACRHRGAALVEDGDGSCKVIACPYHGWTYDLAGRLLAAPGFGALDAAEHGLLPVRAATWQGLVFVCPDLAAPDLTAWLGALPGLCAAYKLAPDMEFFGAYAIEGAANWKTYCDNTVEGYHLPLVHPRLARAAPPDDIRIAAHDGGRLVAFDVAYRAAGSGLRGASGLWFYRFPGFQGVVGMTGFKAERIEPVGADRLRTTSWQWFRDLAPDAREEAHAWSQQIVREDLAICESVQRTMAAGAFRTGVLSPEREQHTAAFQRLVRDAVGEVT